LAARQSASNLKSYETEHFSFWWTTDPTDAHRIMGAPANPLAGDSIPELVRVSAKQLESAWKTYVDTLGYLPPSAYSTTYDRLWNQPVPVGKYPVEFCNVAYALHDSNSAYFGVAYPMGNEGRSLLMLAANIVNFDRDYLGGVGSVGWWYNKDSDSKPLYMKYSTQWREAVMATCAHELYHAVQFNYERQVSLHGFFEASAVAMESRLVPQSVDYLQFSKTLSKLDLLPGFPYCDRDDAYAQGWFVRTVAADLGLDVLKGLWESRKATIAVSPPFLSTLRQILPNYRDSSGRTGSFESELARQAVKLALTGKRSGWRVAGFPGFPDASQFPTLTGILSDSPDYDSLKLELGAVQVQIDTVPAREDRVQVWIPDEGVEMGRAWSGLDGAHVAWYDGSVRWAASDAARNVWGFANPGNPVALRSASRSENSVSFRKSIAAPARTLAHLGQSFSWTSADGPVLKGVALAQAQTTPLLHLDIWKPSASKDPFAASVVADANAHVLVLEDADRVLTLSGATISWPGTGIGSAYIGSGDGVWVPASVSTEAGAGTVQLGELDLSHPVRILWANGSAPSAASQAPRPNPSRKGASIFFPIAGATGTERLDIFAADGGLVREFHTSPGQREVEWDLKNRENRKVRPAVYWFQWRGVSGTKRGQLLVAE